MLSSLQYYHRWHTFSGIRQHQSHSHFTATSHSLSWTLSHTGSTSTTKSGSPNSQSSTVQPRSPSPPTLRHQPQSTQLQITPSSTFQHRTQPNPTSTQQVHTLPPHYIYHFRPHTISTDKCSTRRNIPTPNSDISHTPTIAAYTIATPSPSLPLSPVPKYHQLHFCLPATHSRNSLQAPRHDVNHELATSTTTLPENRRWFTHRVPDNDVLQWIPRWLARRLPSIDVQKRRSTSFQPHHRIPLRQASADTAPSRPCNLHSTQPELLHQ